MTIQDVLQFRRDNGPPAIVVRMLPHGSDYHAPDEGGVQELWGSVPPGDRPFVEWYYRDVRNRTGWYVYYGYKTSRYEEAPCADADVPEEIWDALALLKGGLPPA